MFGFAEYEQVTAYAEQRFAEVCEEPRVRFGIRRRTVRPTSAPSVRRVSVTLVLVAGLFLPAACAPDSDDADGSNRSVATAVVPASESDANSGAGASQPSTAVKGSSVEAPEPARHVPNPPYPVFFPTNRFWPE